MAKVAVNWGSTDDCPVKLFDVTNTSFISLYVLARDEKTAMSIAHTANHIYDPAPISADQYFRNAREIKGPFSGRFEPLERAISQRIEGTVHFENGLLYIGSQVFPK